MRTRRSGSAYGSGRSSAALIGAEDRRRRADAEADRGDDRQRQHRHAQQAADADADVLHEILEHQGALHERLPCLVLLAAIAPRRFEIAELPQRLAPRVVAPACPRDQLLDPHLEVHAQLFVDLRRHRAPPQVPERGLLPIGQAPCSTASTARE